MAEKVYLTATFKVKPGSEDKVREILKEVQNETRKEKGCIKYDLIEALNEPNTFVSLHLALSSFLTSSLFLVLFPIQEIQPSCRRRCK
jgi:hypothetical protein